MTGVPVKIAGRLWIGWIVLAILLFVACSSDPKPEVNDTAQEVTLLFFNDFHGHLLPFERNYKDAKLSGGFARMAQLVAKIREENKLQKIDTFFFNSGDVLQGTPLSTAFEGEVEAKAFKAAGVDAICVGNHDFDYSFEKLLKLQKLSGIPLLSANVFELNSSKMIFDPYQMFHTKNGLTLAVMGLTTPETPVTTHPRNVSNQRFSRPDLAMQSMIDRLDDKSDVLVLLSHLGYKADVEVARHFPQLDVILGGHSHTYLPQPRMLGEVIIAQAVDRGLYLGRVDLQVREDRGYLKNYELIPITDDMSEHPEVAEVIEEYRQKLDSEINKVVGKNEEFLDGERGHIRIGETNLGDLTADLMRLQTRSDLALINSGAIRASIPPGEVTLSHVMRAFPMNNTIVTMQITGEELYYILKRAVTGLTGPGPDELFGGFLQISGLRYTLKNGVPTNIKIGTEGLKLFKTYKVATVDFLAAGGDGYRELKDGRNKYDTGINLRDLMVNYLRERSSIHVSTDGRFTRQ